jgi:hypothetical protein
MPKIQSPVPHPLMQAMAESSTVLADGARAEIEAASAFVQAQAAALPAILATPPLSPANVIAQVGAVWAASLEAATAAAVRAAEVAAKAGAPIVKALRPTA